MFGKISRKNLLNDCQHALSTDINILFLFKDFELVLFLNISCERPIVTQRKF